jgi:outer membrane protein assembly factor BamB
VAPAEVDPPVQFGPEENVAWKVEVPAGVSSPCVRGDRLYLTAFDKKQKQLLILCLNSGSGALIWSRTVAADKIERVHSVSSPAYSTPAADGERVYAYFGSRGLLCYDLAGTLLWDVTFPIPSQRFGSGTSPAVVGDLVVLNRGTTTGRETDDYLLAFERQTGKPAWKLPRDASDETRYPGYATPVVWGEHLVIHDGSGVSAYRITDGSRSWNINIHTYGESTPVIGNNTLFVSAWANFGEPDLHIKPPKYQTLLHDYDRDANGHIHKDEFPDDFGFELRPEIGNLPGGRITIKSIWGMVDKNQDQQLDAREWGGMVAMIKSMHKDHGIIAVRPGGQGDITASHVRWHEKTKIPEVPSPLYCGGRLYTVKNGGIVSCHDAETGELIYRESLEASGPYYASPVSAQGRIYLVSWKGRISVLEAADQLRVLADNDLKDRVTATPALAGDAIYIRTVKHLYAFRKGGK